MRFLLCMFFCIRSIAGFPEENLEDRIILSTPEQIATLYSEPSHLIGGLVSPLSGQFALRQPDLVIKGAENLMLTRYYLPPLHSKHVSTPQEKTRRVE